MSGRNILVVAVVLVLVGGVVLAKWVLHDGLSARATPTRLESFFSRNARGLSIPENAREMQNPIADSAEVLRDKGIPVTRSVTLTSLDNGVENPFGFPVFVKPARLGSSVGITKARTEDELRAGIELAFDHDEKVLVEEFVDGVEVECSVLGNQEPIASIPGEIVANADWYDYSAKYDDGGMELVIPPRVPQEAIERVQELSVEAFRVTDCEGMARADCFVRSDGEVLVNELNTIPGFTATSVYAKLFEASGIPYEELLERLVQLALERHERRARLRF